MKTTIYLVRHGESLKNVQKITQGHKYDHENCLSEKGREEATKLSKNFADINFAICYTSPYLRTKETANILVGHRKEVRIVLEEKLKEKHQGLSIGKSVKETLLAYDDWDEISEVERLDKKQFFGEETQRELRVRVLSVIVDIFENNIGKTILAVTHGGVLRSLYSYYENKSYKDFWKFQNCGYLVLEKQDDKISVIQTHGLSLIRREELF